MLAMSLCGNVALWLSSYVRCYMAMWPCVAVCLCSGRIANTNKKEVAVRMLLGMLSCCNWASKPLRFRTRISRIIIKLFSLLLPKKTQEHFNQSQASLMCHKYCRGLSILKNFQTIHAFYLTVCESEILNLQPDDVRIRSTSDYGHVFSKSYDKWIHNHAS